jgi:hypothetical protein
VGEAGAAPPRRRWPTPWSSRATSRRPAKPEPAEPPLRVSRPPVPRAKAAAGREGPSAARRQPASIGQRAVGRGNGVRVTGTANRGTLPPCLCQRRGAAFAFPPKTATAQPDSEGIGAGTPHPHRLQSSESEDQTMSEGRRHADHTFTL